MAKKFVLLKTFANGNKGVSLVVDKRPKDAFLKAIKADGVVEVELFRLERIKRARVRVVETPAVDENTPEESENVRSDIEQDSDSSQEDATSAAPAVDENTPEKAEVVQSGGKGKGGKRAR